MNTDTDSLYNTGHCYWEGIGINKNRQIAVEYFTNRYGTTMDQQTEPPTILKYPGEQNSSQVSATRRPPTVLK